MASKFELRDTVPAAPSGKINVKWQSDASGNVSAYVDPAGGGGVAFQTPWTQNIDGAGYSLTNTGNVGIGTASPGAALHVKGVSVVENTGSNDNIQLRFRGANANADLWAIGNHIATGGVGRLFEIFDLVTGLTRFRINAGGQVEAPGSLVSGSDISAKSVTLIDATADATIVLGEGTGSVQYTTLHWDRASKRLRIYLAGVGYVIHIGADGMFWTNIIGVTPGSPGTGLIYRDGSGFLKIS